MAAPRAFWKGHLRLSLVTIGVNLHAASASSAKLALHQFHKPSGKRIRYEKVVPGIGPVDAADITRGVEVERDTYVMLTPEELDEVKLTSRHTIDLVQFVDHCEIDPRYFDRPYYVTPDGEAAEEGYVVIRDALRESRKVGIGQMAIRGRENLIAVQPCGRGLLLETLRYADEVRDSDKAFDEVPDVTPRDEAVELARELVKRKSRSFDPSAFHDAYAEALREQIQRKRKAKGGTVIAEDDRRTAEHGNVIDLMKALRESVGKKAGAARTKAPAKRATARGRRKAS